MWLYNILQFFALFVIWVESKHHKNSTTVSVTKYENIYVLDAWSRDPKFDVKRRSNTFFRNQRLRRPVKPANFPSMVRQGTNGTLNNTKDNEGSRRIRKPLREHDKSKTDDIEKQSTRITPMHLVEHNTEKHHRSEENVHKHQDKNKDSDEAEKIRKWKESAEQLSVYSIKQGLDDIAQDIGGETNITTEILGRTFEYNNIVMLKMTQMMSGESKQFRSNDNKYMDEVPEKKIIFIVHGLVTMGFKRIKCLANRKRFIQLLKYYMEHLDKFDIFLIPVANPDGLTATTYNSNWNKNTSPQSSCKGVNLDRNFDVAWNEIGPEGSKQCSQYYPGPNAFSEAETRAIRDVLHHFGHKIAAYIHVHAGTYDTETFKGDAVLYPKGFTEAQSDDDKYMDMKGEIDEMMRNASFQRMTMTTDSLYHWYGKVTGTSVDYAATVFGIPFAMEFVMQPYGENTDKAALTAVWKRVIDAVFNFVYKKGESNNDINRKKKK